MKTSAADGTRFKYVGPTTARLIEFRPAPQCAARAWKVPRIKAADGRLHDWIGVADSGDSIGLDNEARGYVLFPEPDGSAAHLRLNALPEELAIIRATVEPDLAVVELGPRDRSQGKPAIQGEVEGTAGRPPLPSASRPGLNRPLVRVRRPQGRRRRRRPGSRQALPLRVARRLLGSWRLSGARLRRLSRPTTPIAGVRRPPASH